MSNEIKNLVSKKIGEIGVTPKVSIILSTGPDGNPYKASEIYVKNKLKALPEMGIDSELIKVTPDITKEEM